MEADGYRPPHTYRETVLSISVLVFGVFILLLEFALLRKSPHRVTADALLTLYAVTLIVVGTLFLITSGFSDQQIAPAMGLFGSIIGYLLGRRAEATRDKQPRPEAASSGGNEK